MLSLQHLYCRCVSESNFSRSMGFSTHWSCRGRVPLNAVLTQKDAMVGSHIYLSSMPMKWVCHLPAAMQRYSPQTLIIPVTGRATATRKLCSMPRIMVRQEVSHMVPVRR